MDPAAQRQIAKLASANKKVSIENRRLARVVLELETRLNKLEVSVPRAVTRAQAGEKMVARLHRAVVKVVRAIAKLEARLAKRPAAARPTKAATSRAR